MDIQQNVETWEVFSGLVKWGTILTVIVVALLALFLL
ncbi:MAG: aa3-type cytochrome c oxidase subunit IV [Alphaproteobacteria bacterium]|nr:aa3-type cytochrome c oxidase subunit IV [Alphaproteobacteria bacterium]